MEPPHSDDGVVHGVKRRPASSFSFDAHPSCPAAIFIDSVKPVLADHNDWIASL